MPKANLRTVLCGFHSTDEISEAKNVLFNVAENLKSNGSITIDLPRNKVRHAAGDGRRRLHSDDILELWTVVDATKAPLPTFAAVVWKRLPPTSLTDTDLCALTALTSLTDTDLCALTVSMMEMKNRLEELTTQLPAMIKSKLSAWQPTCSRHMYRWRSQVRAATSYIPINRRGQLILFLKRLRW